MAEKARVSAPIADCAVMPLFKNRTEGQKNRLPRQEQMPETSAVADTAGIEQRHGAGKRSLAHPFARRDAMQVRLMGMPEENHVRALLRRGGLKQSRSALHAVPRAVREKQGMPFKVQKRSFRAHRTAALG